MHEKIERIENEEDKCFQPCFVKNKETDIEAYAQEKDGTDKTENLDEEDITRLTCLN
jgi:hypothetical protein